MGKKYAGWDEEGDAEDEIRKGTQTVRADREARRWVKGATQQRMQRYFTCRSMSSVFKLARTALALAF